MLYYNHREGINPEGRKVERMYEVTTITKTIATKVSTEAEAMAIATETFKTYKYVEVKKVVTTSPWYAVSVKILTR